MKLLAIAPLAMILAAPLAAAQKADPAPAATPERAQVVAGMNRFGLEMFAKLSGQPGDLAFSPASATTAFGLAYAGARGQTASEIAATLHYPDLPDFHAQFGGLLKTMNLQQPGRLVSINNALWVHKSTQMVPEYLTLVERHYGAGLRRVDFKGDKALAAATINGWVAGRTNNRIIGLLRPENIRRDTRAYLVNTLYLKADWAEPFDVKATKPETFTMADGRQSKVPLMRQHGDFAFAEQNGVKAVALPYRGGELEMIVLLPKEAGGIGALERSLDAAAFEGWVSRLQAAGKPPVNLALPKFKLQRRMALIKPLVELGMNVPFTDASDFSGMKVADNASPDREDWNFKISDVVQQVFVEVDEKGTEAAAATGIGMVIVTGARSPVEFRADHPFLFAIRDRRNGALLFIGRYSGEAES